MQSNEDSFFFLKEHFMSGKSIIFAISNVVLLHSEKNIYLFSYFNNLKTKKGILKLQNKK